MKKCNLKRLLEETPETYYWIGFILADGHINNNTRIKITLSKKDKNHLIKLQNFLEIENMYENDEVSISGMDSKIIREFCNKFDIKSNKTYNPPNLNINNQDLLFSLSIGFIDGDGCIDNQTNRTDCKLRIKCHSSWLDTLKYIYSKQPYINNQGYVCLNITNSIILKQFKQKALDLDLPIMNRKWDKIDLNFIGRQEQGKINSNDVLKLLKQGIKKSKIAESLGLAKSTISNIIKRNNHEQY